jgi:hypothetical protein
MKTKFISLAATLLLAASANSAFAYAGWVFNSQVNINGTWYRASEFNGMNLGEITSLSLGGISQAKDQNSADYGNDATMTMYYKIDGGNQHEITLYITKWHLGDGGKDMEYESNENVVVPISNLSAGTHSLEVYYRCDDAWDSNNGNNYKAYFTKVNSAISIADNSTGTEVNTTLNNNLDNYVDLTLSGRTLYGGEWNTICLPFNTPVSSTIFTEVKTLKSSSFDAGTLTLNFSENSESNIEAGKPYIVKVNSTIESPTFTNVQIMTASPKDQSLVAGGDDVAIFQGCFDPTEITGSNNLYLGAANTLYYPSTSATIKAFRAYFKLNLPESQASQVKSFVLNFGDETTSITQINNAASATDTYFTLDGRRLNDKPATPGLYIINGKKVVIK